MMNHREHLRILLIDNNPCIADQLQDMLAGARTPFFELLPVDTLAQGLSQLDEDDFDLLLLALELPDSQGSQTLKRASDHAAALPIIVLTARDEATGLRAVREGAQDYLLKGRMTPQLVRHAIRCALERNTQAQTSRLAPGPSRPYPRERSPVAHRGKPSERSIEEGLQRIDERFRTIVNQLPQLVAYTDRDLVYRFVNDRYQEVFGLEAEEILGRRLPEVIGPKAFERARPYVERALSGERVRYRERLDYAIGGPRHIDGILTPHVNGDEEVQGYYAVLTDITPYIQAQDALRARDSLLSKAEKMAGLGSWAWNPESDTFTLSDGWRRVHGCRAEELSSDRFVTMAHPEDRAKLREALSALVEHGELPQVEYRILRQDDGSVRHVQAYGEIEDGHSAREGDIAFGTVQDVTDRKRFENALRESEERFQIMADTAPVLIWMSRVDGLCNFFNQQWLDFRGRTLEEESGDGWAEGVHPEDFERCLNTYRQAFEERREFRMEYRLKRADGRYRWVLDTGVPRFEPDGSFAGFIGSAIDITERKATEEALRRRAEELEALQATVLDITAQHDLSTLLETIVQRAARLLGAPGGCLWVADTDSQQVRCTVGCGAATPCSGKVLPFGTGAAGTVGETAKPIVVNDYGLWPNQAAVIRECVRFKAVLSAPLMWEDESKGVLQVLDDAEEAHFGQEDLELLTLFANHAAIAIENARLGEELRSERRRLRALSQRLVDAQETERRRIARELHDEIGQALTAVKLSIQTANSLPPDCASDVLDGGITAVERALQQVRDLSLDLRPSLLDDLGLIPALRWYIDRQSQRASFSVHFEGNTIAQRLPPDLEVVCFRIAQEAMTNVARHANADHVTVTLHETESALELEIEDDGVGFDVDRALEEAVRGQSMGLLGMQERAAVAGGHIDIHSSLSEGTRLHAVLPFPSDDSAGRSRRAPAV